MSEVPAVAGQAAPATCPIALDRFAPALQKSLNPASPAAVRTMAAKGIIVGAPREQLSALFFLTFDPEAKVAETAVQTASKPNDKLHTGLRDDDLHPEVLAFYARVLVQSDTYLELIVLNQATSDETVAAIAGSASDRVLEIVAQNQLRILRDERIVRALVANPTCRAATRDGVLDFCVRSGLVLRDMPEYLEARRRVLGEDPEAEKKAAEAEANSAERVIEEFGEKLTQEDARVEDAERLTFTQRVMKMSVANKIKLATLGNKEARTLLLRDSNKLVALAAVTSPRITDGEVVALSNSRTLHDDVMRYICNNREWLKNYQVKVNLVNNPKCPVGISLKLLGYLHTSELKKVTQNKNIASTLQTQARAMVAKKEK